MSDTKPTDHGENYPINDIHETQENYEKLFEEQAARARELEELKAELAAAKGEAQHYMVELNECQDALGRVAADRDATRVKLMLTREIISKAADIVDPDCPDTGAYEDGHCDLAGSIARLVVRAHTVEVTEEEWRQLQWAGTRRVDGEPSLYQLNEILAKRTPELPALKAAYLLVEQDMIRCGVSSIVRKLTTKRAHMSWGARVYSELRTVELPGDASLYEVLNGPMAQAYRARSYDFSMTPEEREAQRRSFAFGNANLSNPNVTRALVDEVANELQQEKQDE